MSKTVDHNELDKIAQVLATGTVIALPTDTVYGLSCIAQSTAGRQKICELKERSNQSLIVLVADSEQAKQLVHINDTQQTLLNRYWPGEITFVLEAKAGDTLAVRCPNVEWLRRLLARSGPLVSTSCNPTGKPPALETQQCQSYFDELALYVDAGPCRQTEPSTLIDLTQSPPKLLRQGPIRFCEHNCCKIP